MADSHVALIERVLQRFPDLVRKQSWGEDALFYNPEGKLPNGVYFLTVKTRNGPNDAASRLDRVGAFRVSFGVSKPTYRRLWGDLPKRPAAGGTIEAAHDFAAFDQIMPHPVYGWMAWVSVLNLSSATEAAMMPLLDEAYAIVQRKHG